MMITEPDNPTYNAVDVMHELGFDITTPVRIGETLRAFRKAEGVTLKQIAKQLGISEQRLSDYEHSRYYPSYDRMLQWATLVGYNPVFALQEQLMEQLQQAHVPIKTLKLTLKP